MRTLHWVREFIASKLFAVTLPSVPFKDRDWSGFAFDRNRHENLAPDYVWLAWLAAHRASGGDVNLIVYSDSLPEGAACQLIESTLEALQSYWSADSQFLSDHYLVDPSGRWIVRLDQDVTLFSGERGWIQQVCCASGGIEVIVADMIRDFDPGVDDSAGLRKFIDEVTAGLR